MTVNANLAAMLFESVKGFDIPVVTGILASRERVAPLLVSTVERLIRLKYLQIAAFLAQMRHETGTSRIVIVGRC